VSRTFVELSRDSRRRNAGAAISCLVLAALAAAPPPARAQECWDPAGIPVASTLADRVFPVAVGDGERGAFVAWQEYARIRLQRITAAGEPAPGWSRAQGRVVCIPSGYGGYEQSSPRVAADGAGGVYVIWHDQRNSGCTHLCLGDPKQVFVQRFGPDGAVAAGWPEYGVSAGSWLSRMSPTPGGTRGYPGEMNTVVTEDGRGGLLLAWIEQPIRGNTEPGLRVQRIASAGERLWGERGVRICALPGVPQFPSIAADFAGGAIVVWQDLRDPGDGSRLYVQHVSSTGVPLLRQNGERATTGSLTEERHPRLVAQGRDGALLVWEAGEGDEASSLFARRVVTLGRHLRTRPEVVLTATALPAGDVALLPDAARGAWAAWIDVRSGTSRDVYAQRLLRNGMLMPGWPAEGAPVVVEPSADRSRPMLAGDGAGGAFVGWRDAAAPRVMLLNPHGRPARGWPAAGAALTTDPGVDRGLDLVASGPSGAIGVWDQWLSNVGIDDVRAQRVERSRFELRPPLRLDPGAGEFEPATEAQAPAEPAEGLRFALHGLAPNPSPGPVTVSLALPSAEPATLELFDVAGRRVAAADVGSLGAGRHLVRLTGEARLSPGLYVIRLTQGSRQLSARGFVSR